jgi:hypothetical protein
MNICLFTQLKQRRYSYEQWCARHVWFPGWTAADVHSRGVAVMIAQLYPHPFSLSAASPLRWFLQPSLALFGSLAAVAKKVLAATGGTELAGLRREEAKTGRPRHIRVPYAWAAISGVNPISAADDSTDDFTARCHAFEAAQRPFRH